MSHRLRIKNATKMNKIPSTHPSVIMNHVYVYHRFFNLFKKHLAWFQQQQLVLKQLAWLNGSLESYMTCKSNIASRNSFDGKLDKNA